MKSAVTLLFTLAFLGVGQAQNLPKTKIPQTIEEQLEPHLEQVYATYGDRELQLDLYRPKSAEGLLPAIVCIHGGAWWKGDRINFSNVAKALAARGYVTATISYRLSGEEPFPAQIHDCKAAVRWLRANAEQYGIDPDRIGATGSSAGGHLAALLGSSAEVNALEGGGGNQGVSTRIQAAAPMGAQTDLMSERIRLRSKAEAAKFYPQFLGGTQEEAPETYRLASPLTHLDKGDSPMLFLAGELDDPSTHADVYRAKMDELGISNHLFVIPKAPHSLLVSQAYFDRAIDEVDQFFSEHLKKKTP